VVDVGIFPRTRRRIYLKTLVVADTLFGRGDAMIPRWGIWNGKNASELKASGDQFLQYFIDVCGLKPDARVLDVGCGIGRIAVALTHYLTSFGSYEGLDVIPEAIRWCNRKITPNYPNFHFRVADVINKSYNARGALRAAEYALPYDDSTFDFVFLGSVFTHMLPEEVERYLGQVTRVLKERGWSLITYFLLTPEALDSIRRGESTIPFTHEGNGFRTVNEKLPESAVAYDESSIKGLYDKNGLKIVNPIRCGTWSNYVSDFEYQDFIIAEKGQPVKKRI
jgi:ubiquinone/menaquinone biosynthesis C-methylase UbiE